MTRSELLERAKPILFNTCMVRAIQGGTKTVTRRVIKPQPTYSENDGFVWKGKEYGTPPAVSYDDNPYNPYMLKHKWNGKRWVLKDGESND